MSFDHIEFMKLSSDLQNLNSNLEARLGEVMERLQRLDVLERRLEEAIAYFALRSNRLVNSQSTYLGDHVAVTFLENGLRILADTRSMDVGMHLLTLGLWEPNYMRLFDGLLKPGNTVLDIGANHGVYALHAALGVGPAGRVHAFEPNPKLARLVDLSLKINGFGSYATLHSCGVSDGARKALLDFSDAFSGGGVIAQTANVAGHQQTECDLVSLDEVFPSPDFKVDLIKMDVEGHEGFALRGMRNLLERSPDVKIMMEFGPEMMARAGFPAADAIMLLSGLGFSMWNIDEKGGLEGVSPEDLIRVSSGIRNILICRRFPL